MNSEINWQERIAVIILNYNSSDLTSECANSLLNLYENIKIVIVDNCSTDESRDKLSSFSDKSPRCYFVANDRNSGYAAGNNVGIRYVEKNIKDVDTICIMNPDICIGKYDVLERLHTSLWYDPKIAVITAQTIYNGKVRMPNDFGWRHLTTSYMIFSGTILGKLLKPSLRYTKVDVDSKMVAKIDIAQGCFFVAKMDVLRQVGFLDEGTFLYSEEAILGKKIQRIGYTAAVLMDAFIYHNHREKEKSLRSKQSKLFDMNCFYNSRKYYINNYSDKAQLTKLFACVFLDIDHFIKKLIVGLR